MRERGLRGEDHNFKARHVVRITVREGWVLGILSPLISIQKTMESKTPFKRKYLVVLKFHPIFY